MTPSQIDSVIRRVSAEEGFLGYGAAAVVRLTSEVAFLKNYIERGFHAEMGYLKRNIEIRENPLGLLEDAKSVLCFLVPYRQEVRQREGIPKLASYAYGLDYHKIVRDKIYNVMESLKGQVPDLKYRVFCDSAPILERAWANRAGLGFIGKNRMLISKTVGLHTIIGIALINRELSYGTPIKSGCGGCTRCLDACPAGALTDEGLDSRRCISYQTIESKRLRHEEPFVLKSRSNWYFGCDICIDACPWSSKGPISGWDSFKPLRYGEEGRELTEITREEWLNMSEDFFKLWFSSSPIMRAGLTKIKDSIE